VNSVLVGSLDDVQRRAVVILATLDWAMPQALEVEPPSGWHPFQAVHVADQNFVFFHLEMMLV